MLLVRWPDEERDMTLLWKSSVEEESSDGFSSWMRRKCEGWLDWN
jgi:hypothetical protein